MNQSQKEGGINLYTNMTIIKIIKWTQITLNHDT